MNLVAILVYIYVHNSSVVLGIVVLILRSVIAFRCVLMYDGLMHCFVFSFHTEIDPLCLQANYDRCRYTTTECECCTH